MPSTVKVTGVKEALASLKKWQVIKTEACRIALKEIGFKVEAQAKGACPVDTGRLRASISTNWSGSPMNEGKTGSRAKSGDGIKRPGGPPGLCVVVGTNITYGPFVEHGTKKQNAQPYLFPAYFSHEGEVEKRLSRILKEEVRV